MPRSAVYLHFVWSTKYRVPILSTNIRHQLLEHIRKNAPSKNIHIICINGYVDHLHCLVQLKSGQTIDKIMMLIKGESAHWFNLQDFGVKLEWQSEYFVSSVCQSNLIQIKNYIYNQEKHHSQMTSEQEFLQLLKRHRLS
jgi:REP element-mobilizing transposase RayT